MADSDSLWLPEAPLVHPELAQHGHTWGHLHPNDRFATPEEVAAIEHHLQATFAFEESGQLRAHLLAATALLPEQQAVIAAAKGHVGENEAQGPNICPTTQWWQSLFGWGVGQPYCAMGQCRVGSQANVLSRVDFSAGAWNLANHLASLPGGRLSSPEIGCVQTYNWGEGHIEGVVGLDPDPNYDFVVGFNTGSGNPAEGDGVFYLRRYLPGQLFASAPWARFPGIAAAIASHGATPPAGWYTPKPARPFMATGKPPFGTFESPRWLVQVNGHPEVYEVLWQDGHGYGRWHVPDRVTLAARERVLNQTVLAISPGDAWPLTKMGVA